MKEITVVSSSFLGLNLFHLSAFSHFHFLVVIILYLTSGSLAQLVEQRTLNQWVAGSIPARPTRSVSRRHIAFCFSVFCFPIRLVVYSERYRCSPSQGAALLAADTCGYARFARSPQAIISVPFRDKTLYQSVRRTPSLVSCLLFLVSCFLTPGHAILRLLRVRWGSAESFRSVPGRRSHAGCASS